MGNHIDSERNFGRRCYAHITGHCRATVIENGTLLGATRKVNGRVTSNSGGSSDLVSRHRNLASLSQLIVTGTKTVGTFKVNGTTWLARGESDSHDSKSEREEMWRVLRDFRLAAKAAENKVKVTIAEVAWGMTRGKVRSKHDVSPEYDTWDAAGAMLCVPRVKIISVCWYAR